MPSYKLLRSNKETGPYSLDDLVRVGLKPYDLVWVQDKSAAWRYPSEVEELKPYAPEVEEQPYDRFYKKKTPVKEEPVLAQEQSYQKTVVVEEKPAFEEKYAKYIPKKSVFVTMPGQKSAVAVQKPMVAEPQPTPEPVITVTENPAAAQIKYSQPLDEIKEMYVKTLRERKHKIARKGFLISSLKKAAIIAGLILSGILAGYFIKSKADGKKELAAIPTTPQQVLATQTIPQSSSNEPVQPQEPANPVITQPSRQVPVTQSTEPVAEKNTMPPAVFQRLLQQEKKQYNESKLKNEPVRPPVIKETYEPPSAGDINNASSGERIRQVRNNNTPVTNTATTPTESKPISRGRKAGLDRLVTVSSNDYKRVAFGGIRNLELTVTNDSKYVVDKVTVELQYLKPNELPLRTETVQFHSISPNGSSTLKIADTNRGIKVLYKIIDIQSMQSETAASGF